MLSASSSVSASSSSSSSVQVSDEEDEKSSSNEHSSDSDSGIPRKSARKESVPDRTPKQTEANGTNIGGTGLEYPSNVKLEQALKAKQLQGGIVRLSDDEFYAIAKKAGLPDEVCSALTDGVHKYVKALVTISPDERSQLSELQAEIEQVRNFPADQSRCRQAKTVTVAGATAYLTSFFLGKLAINLAMLPVANPHCGWTFLVAGLLNSAVTEPLAQGIRESGAAYASPDGKAYTDYHTASQWMKKAAAKNDQAGVARWRREMASIVDDVIKRETRKGIKALGSGIREISRDASGNPVSATTVDRRKMEGQRAEAQVIAAAKRRAYITDEVPLFTFFGNYTISGALAPMLKSVLPLWGFVAADLLISASLGTLSGVETASLQNILRAYIQGAPLRAEAPELKQARQNTAYKKLDIWAKKADRIRQIRHVLLMQSEALRAERRKGGNVSAVLAEVMANLAEVKKAYKHARSRYYSVERNYNLHNSKLGRVSQSIRTSMSSYMGEVSSNPGPMGGIRAKYRMYSKLIGYPLSLVAYVAWLAYTMPGIVAAVYPTVTNVTDGLNHTSVHGLNDSLAGMAAEPAPAVQGDPGFEAAKMNLQMGLSALSGLPLIIGFTMRLQCCSQWAESAIVAALDGGYAAQQRRMQAPQKMGDDDEVTVSDSDSEVSVSSDFSEDSQFDSDWSSDNFSDEDASAGAAVSARPARLESVGRSYAHRFDRTKIIPPGLNDDSVDVAAPKEEKVAQAEQENQKRSRNGPTGLLHPDGCEASSDEEGNESSVVV